MTKAYRVYLIALLLVVVTCSLIAAEKPTPGILSAQELKKIVPAGYFFDGQSAPVQLRNSVGARTKSGKLVLAGLVDTSGYSADIQQKYQGFFITETKLAIEGSDLTPGQYGFGFTKDGKFVVMNVAATDVLNVDAKMDDKLARPVPLKLVEDGDALKLYAGKKWVSIKPE